MVGTVTRSPIGTLPKQRPAGLKRRGDGPCPRTPPRTGRWSGSSPATSTWTRMAWASGAALRAKFNSTSFIEGDAVPLVLRLAPPDDRDRVLFSEHRMMRPELALHARLRERTDVPLPEILAHDFSGRDLDRDYLLMERLPGSPIAGLANLTRRAFDDILHEVGRGLRQVHGLTGDRYGYGGEHRPMEPQTDWPGAFAVMWHKLLDDIERCGGSSPDEATRRRRLLDRPIRVFDRPVPAALLHTDVWAENLLG
jgi:hypothetical protein